MLSSLYGPSTTTTQTSTTAAKPADQSSQNQAVDNNITELYSLQTQQHLS